MNGNIGKTTEDQELVDGITVIKHTRGMTDISEMGETT